MFFEVSAKTMSGFCFSEREYTNRLILPIKPCTKHATKTNPVLAVRNNLQIHQFEIISIIHQLFIIGDRCGPGSIRQV